MWKNTREEFYVYGIFRDQEICYIGKGTGNRVLQSMRIHRGVGFIILANNVTSSIAYDIEQVYIYELKPIDNKQGIHGSLRSRYILERGYYLENNP